jgi:hypothetical protein
VVDGRAAAAAEPTVPLSPNAKETDGELAGILEEDPAGLILEELDGLVPEVEVVDLEDEVIPNRL